MLVANPDVYTLWNYRREIILALKPSADAHKTSGDVVAEEVVKDEEVSGEQSSKEEKIDEVAKFQKLCEDELELTSVCIQKNIKSYSSWHHRSWIIRLMPEPDLKREISLCNQLLEVDERNCKK